MAEEVFKTGEHKIWSVGLFYYKRRVGYKCKNGENANDKIHMEVMRCCPGYEFAKYYLCDMFAF